MVEETLAAPANPYESVSGYLRIYIFIDCAEQDRAELVLSRTGVSVTLCEIGSTPKVICTGRHCSDNGTTRFIDKSVQSIRFSP